MQGIAYVCKALGFGVEVRLEGCGLGFGQQGWEYQIDLLVRLNSRW